MVHLWLSTLKNQHYLKVYKDCTCLDLKSMQKLDVLLIVVGYYAIFAPFRIDTI